MIEKFLKESTEKCYNTPRYELPCEDDKLKFLGRVNDGKGNDADTYIVKSNNYLVFLQENHVIISGDIMRETNSTLYNNGVELSDRNKKDTVLSYSTKLRNN